MPSSPLSLGAQAAVAVLRQALGLVSITSRVAASMAFSVATVAVREGATVAGSAVEMVEAGKAEGRVVAVKEEEAREGGTVATVELEGRLR